MTDKTKSAAVIPPPKKRGFGLDKLVAEPAAAADNMKEEEMVKLTFNVPLAFHTELKTVAGAHRITMKEILFEGYDLWKQKKQIK